MTGWRGLAVGLTLPVWAPVAVALGGVVVVACVVRWLAGELARAAAWGLAWLFQALGD